MVNSNSNWRQNIYCSKHHLSPSLQFQNLTPMVPKSVPIVSTHHFVSQASFQMCSILSLDPRITPLESKPFNQYHIYVLNLPIQIRSGESQPPPFIHSSKRPTKVSLNICCFMPRCSDDTILSEWIGRVQLCFDHFLHLPPLKSLSPLDESCSTHPKQFNHPFSTISPLIFATLSCNPLRAQGLEARDEFEFGEEEKSTRRLAICLVAPRGSQPSSS